MKSKLQVEWGFDGIIVSTDKYSARIMVVNEGKITPYGYNRKQDKTIYVLQGIINLEIEGKTRTIEEGGRYHIRPGVKHSVYAVQGDATIIEVGTKIEDDFIEV